ncbi:3-hydroxyacyl-CoA dehydrogenase family protein [Metapseudomonas otitidis]|uniref:3-hydroxyacyl-CoA dehydrogenase family protein n=1 Tax=Metapseudomonas otitidis TaxID=319939 RepID=UPI0008F08303|nr:3-hydroxyacyl-CoA dehydrogenase NAD-binding domain-containing protein [Pseudomonas otitidis]SFA65048.1 3-hydroxybutyryl-CoA dehydrogenase [Pseudomonas otitidis]
MDLIGVVGAGTMGTGVAINAALAGFEVVLVEKDTQAFEAAPGRLRTALQLTALLDRSKVEHLDSQQDALRRISIESSLDRLAQAMVVFECISESLQEKQELYEELDRICARDTLFASNTSCIEINVLAQFTHRPSKVLGVHFMNPASLRPFVEITKGRSTSEQTLNIATKVLAALGKDHEIVNDSPGFVINRVLMLAINEAIGVVEEQVADCRQVDNLFEKCLGHKTGPLATADLIGLDVIADSLIVLRNRFDNGIYEPKSLLKEKVARGELGVKSKQGFYKY